MNTFKKYSIAALSISLLVSAPAQAVGFAELYKQAGQYAQNLWANRPSMPAISMPKISMPSVSREQVEAGIEMFANGMQKAETVIAQYPKTVAAVSMAAKAAPFALVGGYLAKNIWNETSEFYKNYKKVSDERLNEDLLKMFEDKDVVAINFNTVREAVINVDKDLIAGIHITANTVLAEVNSQLYKDKNEGALNFEEKLSHTVSMVPNYLPGLQKDWKRFVKLAIAYDKATHVAFGKDLIDAYNNVCKRIAVINDLIDQAQKD